MDLSATLTVLSAGTPVHCWIPFQRSTARRSCRTPSAWTNCAVSWESRNATQQSLTVPHRPSCFRARMPQCRKRCSFVLISRIVSLWRLSWLPQLLPRTLFRCLLLVVHLAILFVELISKGFSSILQWESEQPKSAGSGPSVSARSGRTEQSHDAWLPGRHPIVPAENARSQKPAGGRGAALGLGGFDREATDAEIEAAAAPVARR